MTIQVYKPSECVQKLLSWMIEYKNVFCRNLILIYRYNTIEKYFSDPSYVFEILEYIDDDITVEYKPCISTNLSSYEVDNGYKFTQADINYILVEFQSQ